jgi:hypothetical protein
MLKRTAEIILGLAITISLIAKYGDETHEMKLLIWYVLTPTVLQVIAWIGLFLVALRLINRKSNA